MRLPPLSFAVLDTETTGFVPRTHRVIEYADIVAREGKEESTFEQLFLVEEEIPPHVQVLTRITPAMLSGKPTFDQKRDEIMERLDGVELLVGQNLGYDIGMLRGEGIDLSDRPWVDTSLLASLVFPELKSFSLPYMSATLDLTHEPAHRALGDVRATLELLARVWERLLELPEKELHVAKQVMAKSEEGYSILFDALPASKSKKAMWMQCRERKASDQCEHFFALAAPKADAVLLQEEGLHPRSLQCIVNAAASDLSVSHWIAVKNLEHTLERITVPEGARVLHPSNLLLDPETVEPLRKQKSLTPEEATLSLKIAWFQPRTRFEIALHGAERDVWFGRLACTATSKQYLDQFLPSDVAVYILDHQQLLAALADEKHVARALLKGDTHVIIDDASMLEDTATKAYGLTLSLDDVRAAASGDDQLQHVFSLLAIWAERTRTGEDQHFLTQADFTHPETSALQKLIATERTRTDLAPKTMELLATATQLLLPDLITENIVWIYRMMDGRIIFNSAPRHVDALLQEKLYERFATTLLVPKGAEGGLPEIVPLAQKVAANDASVFPACPVSVSFEPQQGIGTYLRSLPRGKTVMLVASKRLIEQAFIEHTEALEEQGIMLICQGLSGGQGRMEEEFLAAEGDVILLVTPYMYEGFSFPEGTVGKLIIDTVPFDAPSHAVVGRRKDRYKSGFMEYILPRAEFRLFRLLRTFCRHRKEGAEVTVFDSRLTTKEYGKRLMQYLEQFGGAEPSENVFTARPLHPKKARKPKSEKPKKAAKKKDSGAQMELPL